MTTDINPSTESSAAAQGLVEPDSTRVQQLEPAALILDANVRHDATPDRAMIASVRDHGILQPIIAFATGDGRARVRIGHRRTLAAIAAGATTVPVIVHPTRAAADSAVDDPAREIDRIAQQTQENHVRKGLSVTEQLDAFADLNSFGLTAGQIAATTKTRRRDVAAALAATRVPEVREAVESAGLTLEQGATLAEFADQPADYERLLEEAVNPRSWGPGFDHTAQQLRDRRDEAVARQARLAELAEAGTPVIDGPIYGGAATRLIDLTDDPEPDTAHSTHVDAADLDEAALVEDDLLDDLDAELDDEHDRRSMTGSAGGAPAPITPEAHATCPGHAAYVGTDFAGPGRARRVVAVYVCTDPLGHGHHSRTGAPLRAASESAVPRADETPEQAADREAAEKAAQSASRKRVIAGNKAWDSATTVRREWLAELLTLKTPPKGTSSWVAQAFLIDRYTVCRAAERGHRTAAELLCTTPAATGQADHQRVLAALDGASENRASVITLGLVLGAIEGETDRHQWRWNEHHSGRPDAGLARYLEALTGWGYTLSPIERLAIGQDVDDAELFDAPTPSPAHEDDHVENGDAGEAGDDGEG